MTKSENIVELTKLLQLGQRFSLASIADKFGVSKRTARRYLDELERARIFVEVDLSGSDKLFYLPQDRRKVTVYYTILDVLSLFVARRFFDFLQNTRLEEHIAAIYAGIERQLDSSELDKAHRLQRKVFLVHEGPKVLQEAHSEALDACLDGLLYECPVRMTYENSDGRRKQLTVHPYTLTLYKRGLYLVGKDVARDQVRVYALERIHDADCLRDQRFDYPDDWDPEAFFAQAFCLVPGDPEEVEVAFSPTTYRFIHIRRFHPTQRIDRDPDGTVRLTMHVPVTFELVNWVLSFGPHAKVLRPAHLRDQVVDALHRAANNYTTDQTVWTK